MCSDIKEQRWMTEIYTCKPASSYKKNMSLCCLVSPWWVFSSLPLLARYFSLFILTKAIFLCSSTKFALVSVLGTKKKRKVKILLGAKRVHNSWYWPMVQRSKSRKLHKSFRIQLMYTQRHEMLERIKEGFFHYSATALPSYFTGKWKCLSGYFWLLRAIGRAFCATHAETGPD